MSGVATGGNTTAWYRWEDGNFAGDASTSSIIPFGPDATVDSDDGKNNAVRVFAPDTKEAADIIAQNFEGSFSVSFTLADPWFLGAIFGDPSSTQLADGTYDHVYNGSATKSMQIVEGFRGSGNKRLLRGCVASRVQINPRAPGVVEVSINGAYADESHPSETIQSQPAPDYKSLTYAESRLDLDGTKVKYVQDASLTINLKPDLVQALDSRTAVDFWTGAREPDIDYTTLKESGNEDPLADFYGSSTATSPSSDVAMAPLTMEFTSSGETNTITINLGGGFPDEYGHNSVGDPNQALEQNLNRMVKTVDAVANNDTSSAP